MVMLDILQRQTDAVFCLMHYDFAKFCVTAITKVDSEYLAFVGGSNARATF